MPQTLVRRYQLKIMQRISTYICFFILLIHLFFAGLSLYTAVTGLLLSVLVGLSVALIEVYLFPGRLAHLPFTLALVMKTGLYLLFLVLFLIPLSFLISELYHLLHIFNHHNLPFRRTWQAIPTDWRGFIHEPRLFLRTLVIYAVGCFCIVFLSQISRILGPQMLKNLILGKYAQPVEETRIFMFLDLKSSTSIAEQMDNLTYSHFLKDIYFHIGEPILKCHGEIYQYVGDEVVLSWPIKGKDKQAPWCLECFWSIQKILSANKDYYQQHYGVIPEFKAGLHCGPVVVTLVGDVKRQLVYHGDVMNTTARIQQECNLLGQKLLLSESLTRLLLLPEGKHFQMVDRVGLKGKHTEMALYTVRDSLPDGLVC